MKVLFVFVDGLGLGKDDAGVNPCVSEEFKLLKCIERGNGPLELPSNGLLIPTDAVLGVQGLPQSATGQTSLFSGVNCSRLVGRHVQGFPNETLREVIREKSILKQLKEKGLSVRFINAFRPLFFKLPEKLKWRLSVTTITALAADCPILSLDDLAERRSIYHDMTNFYLVEKGFDVPRFTPEEAADILIKSGESHEFVLYEYFLTDRAGHSQNMQIAKEVLLNLERFMKRLIESIDPVQTLIVLTSDHGNVEDLSVKTHTVNRVPTMLWGRGADILKSRIHSLTDISPALLSLFKDRGDQ